MEASVDTKEKILGAARRLMLDRGFNATTVDDICAKARVTKGAFFHYFGSKDELGGAVLEHHCRLTAGALEKAPFRAEKDPLARFLKYIDLIAESVNDPVQDGCLIGLFSSELGPGHK